MTGKRLTVGSYDEHRSFQLSTSKSWCTTVSCALAHLCWSVVNFLKLWNGCWGNEAILAEDDCYQKLQNLSVLKFEVYLKEPIPLFYVSVECFYMHPHACMICIWILQYQDNFIITANRILIWTSCVHNSMSEGWCGSAKSRACCFTTTYSIVTRSMLIENCKPHKWMV
jgi:hypothetical protein